MSDFTFLGSFLAVFCRVGCCFMLLPGISSMRVPTIVRLFLALGISLALSPLLAETEKTHSAASPDLSFLFALAQECITGLTIGLSARVMFSAIQTAGSLIMQVSGYGHPFSIDNNHGEPSSELGALVGSTVVVLLFVLDFHHFVIEALVRSYHVINFGGGMQPALELERLLDIVSASFRVALAVSGPFVVASFLINLAFGMLNRMTPHLPVYFISASFLMGLMLLLAWQQVPEIVRVLLLATREVLQRV